MRKLLSVLFWSVLSAAFIGPGTVTTAAKAGFSHGYALLWALTFSTIACIVLQEAAARITVVSGRSLGQAIRERFHGSALREPVIGLVLLAIVFGCAAYQTGNILGAISGAELWRAALPQPLLALGLGVIAATVLLLGSPRWVATALGLAVAVMGAAFLWTAVSLRPEPVDVVEGAFRPRFPDGTGMLILGLIGTTVVPYNLFLGSGLARGRELSEVRFGITVAVGLGGVISMGVAVVGAAMIGLDEFSFDGLARTLTDRLGDGARPLFAFGLFAAGLSSAVTAPLAAALTATSLLTTSGKASPEEEAPRVQRSACYRVTWIVVLATGVGFAMCDLRPVPAILFAQALNGLLLPIVAVLLWILVNDERLLGRARNGILGNVLLGAVVVVAVGLGLKNLWLVVL